MILINYEIKNRCLSNAKLDRDKTTFDKRVMVLERRIEKKNEQSGRNEWVVLDDLETEAGYEYNFSLFIHYKSLNSIELFIICKLLLF